MLRINRKPLHMQSGVTLVEMMVAIVVGLIVIAAVLALIVSIMKANRQSIETTRLMQEMRATAAVITADVRRARGVADPLATVKQPDPVIDSGTPPEVFRRVDTRLTAAADCIRFAYDGGASGPFRVVYRDASENKILISGGGGPADAACGGGGVELTSDQVEITSLTFVRLPLLAGCGNPPAPPALPPAACEPPPHLTREIRMSMTGRLVNPDPQIMGITRTLTQSIFVRAVGNRKS